MMVVPSIFPSQIVRKTFNFVNQQKKKKNWVHHIGKNFFLRWYYHDVNRMGGGRGRGAILSNKAGKTVRGSKTKWNFLQIYSMTYFGVPILNLASYLSYK
jgi:hypothetical protein